MIFLNVVVWSLVAAVTVPWFIVCVTYWYDSGYINHSSHYEKVADRLEENDSLKRAEITDSSKLRPPRSSEYWALMSNLIGAALCLGFIIWLAGVVQVAVWVYGG